MPNAGCSVIVYLVLHTFRLEFWIQLFFCQNVTFTLICFQCVAFEKSLHMKKQVFALRKHCSTRSVFFSVATSV